jgi:hypothetical protein
MFGTSLSSLTSIDVITSQMLRLSSSSVGDYFNTLCFLGFVMEKSGDLSAHKLCLVSLSSDSSLMENLAVCAAASSWNTTFNSINYGPHSTNCTVCTNLVIMKDYL